MSNHSATDAIKGIEKAIVDAGFDQKNPRATLADLRDYLYEVEKYINDDTQMFISISEMAACLIILAKQSGVSLERCLVHALATLHLGES